MQDKKRKIFNTRKAVIQTACSPEGYDFDLSRLSGEEYASTIDMVFGTDKFVDVIVRRHRLVESLSARGSNPAIIVNGMRKCDEQMARMIYEAMFLHCIANDPAATDGDPADIMEFFGQFRGDEEKAEMCVKFWNAMMKMYMAGDVLMSYLTDAKYYLDKLDKDQRFINLHSMKASMGNLQNMASRLANFRTEEENKLFAQTCESIEGYFDMRAEAFDKKIKKMHKDWSKADAAEKKEKRQRYEAR